MKQFIISFFFLCCFFGGNNLFAQTPLSLQDAVSVGLKNNYEIQITNKQVSIAENNDSWGAAGAYPTINFGVNLNNRFDNQPLQTSDERYKYSTNTLYPFVNLRWTLFNGFSTRISKKNYEALKNSAQGYETIAIENTLQDIIVGYYQALLEKEKLAVQERVMKLSHDKYNDIIERQKLGAAVTFDVLQFKNAFLSDSVSYISQQIMVDNAIRSLQLVMADAENTPYDLTDKFDFEIQAYQLEDLIAKVKTENQVLQTQKLNEQIQENSVQMSRSSLYPNISVNAGIDHFANRITPDIGSSSTNWRRDFYANLSISYTIFNGFSRKRNIQNAKIQSEITRTQTQQTEHSLVNSIQALHGMYELRVQLFNVTEENMKTAELNLQIAEDKFKSGTISSFIFRDIQLIYQNAAIARLTALYNLIETNTELTRMTGGIISNQ